MRIVHIITRLIIGGAQENTLLSCEGQSARGHEVTLITGPAIGPEGSLMDRANLASYRVETIDDMRRSIHPIKDFRAYRQLTRRLADIQPDIVHTHSSKAGILGRRAAHAVRVDDLPNFPEGLGRILGGRAPHAARQGLGRAAIIHTIHGLAFTASTSPFVNHAYKKLESWVAPITDKIVCVADAMRDQSLAAGIGRPEQYVTVYSGMETTPFLNPPVPREVVRKQLGLSDDQVVVGTIARLFHLKGHDDLIDVAPQLCAKFPNLRFLWIGDGLLRENFESRIQQLGLSDRFILTGLVPPEKIPQLANAMDILVHPSRREGLARALPQGALCGLPCVTYDIDGAKEGVIDGESGFILPPFDGQKLSASIAKLAADPALRHSMGVVGRKFALSRFDAGVMVDALQRVYDEVRKRKEMSAKGTRRERQK